MKIMKVHDSEIRRCLGEEGYCICIIGQVRELLEKEIIFADNTKGNMDKWLCVDRDKKVREFDSLEDAKNFCKEVFAHM